jgi:GPH family glycoside/pentoside/hexuronide:cation symporter
VTETDAPRGRITLKTKLAFSSGSLEEAMLGAAGIATMIFYNQVLGVSAALCGTVFLIASIVDAFSDPLIGAWSDNFQSRWGRRHPFMLFAALPLTLAFYLMYNPPEGLSEMNYFWWFLGTMALLRVGKTFYSIPHAAMGAELSDDYHERTSIFGFNSVSSMVAGVLLGVFVLVVIFPTTGEYENGLLNPDGYPVLATVGAAWVCITLLICVFGTRDQIPNLHQIDNRQPLNYANYLKDLSALLKSRSYVSICAAWLVIMSSGGVLAVVSTYTYIFCYELSTETLTIQRFVTLPGILIAIPLASWLTRRLDKKLTVIFTSVTCATLIGLPHLLRMIGWFPENDSPWMIPLLFGCMFLGYLALPVVPIVIDSQLVDVTDEHEYRTGQRAEGVIFSVRTFAIKATSGVGGLLAGFGLEFIEFPKKASIENLTPEMLNGLLFMSGPLYWIICFTGMLFMSMYTLNESRHREIMTALASRRAITQSS